MKQNSFLNSQYLNNSVKYTAFILYCFSSKLKVVLSRLLRTRKPYRVQSLVLRMSPSQGQPYGLSAGTGNATRSPPLLPPRQPRKKTSCSSQPLPPDWLCRSTPLPLLFRAAHTGLMPPHPVSCSQIPFPNIPLAKTSLGQIKPAFLITQILLLSVPTVLIFAALKEKFLPGLLSNPDCSSFFFSFSSIASSLPVNGHPVSRLPLLRSTSDLQLGVVWTTSVKGLP